MEAHGPYRPPEGYGTGDIGVSIAHSLGHEPVRNGTVTAYEGEVRYLADVYQRIFSRLSDESEYVFSLADNGEMLGEDGFWVHTYGLYPEIAYVLLVISGEALEGESDATIGLNDVHLTLEDLFDLKSRSTAQSLLEEDVDSGKRFVEYHGRVSTAAERLTDEGVSQDAITELESVRLKLAAPLMITASSLHTGSSNPGPSPRVNR